MRDWRTGAMRPPCWPCCWPDCCWLRRAMICCWRAWFCCWRDWSWEAGSFISWPWVWVSVFCCWDVMAWEDWWVCCCCLRPPVAWASCSLSEEAESSASGALMEREKESVRRRGGMGGLCALLCGSWRVLRTKLGRRLLCHLCLLVMDGRARVVKLIDLLSR